MAGQQLGHAFDVWGSVDDYGRRASVVGKDVSIGLSRPQRSRVDQQRSPSKKDRTLPDYLAQSGRGSSFQSS